jgi:hypothetical protein
VYPSSVDFPDAKSPLDVLRAFVNVYGVEFKIGDLKSPHRFVFYESFPAPPNKEFNILTVPQHKGTVETHCVFRIDHTKKFVEMALAYAIDSTRYMEGRQPR